MNIIISKNVQDYIRKIKYVFERNMMTLIIVALYTIWEAAIAAIPYEYYWDIHFFVGMIERMLLYLIIPSLFIETYFEGNKVKCVCGYIIAISFSGVVAACGDLYIFSGVAVNMDLPVDVLRFLPADILRIAGPRGSLLKHNVELFFCGIMLILSVAAVYKCFKKSQLHFEEYVAKIFYNIVKMMIIWIILEIFSACVDSIMAGNFFHKYYFEYDMQIQGRILVMDTFYFGPVGVLAMGFYLGTEMIAALRGIDEEPVKTRHKIAGEILPVLILWFIGTVYVCFFMLLIKFLAQMQVFTIISALFWLGLPVWIMTGYDTEKSLYVKMISILPYLFIPLLLLQVYSLGVEIYQYGMTRERYVGMMIIIFEIGTLYIRHFRKGQYQKLLPFFVLIVIVTFFVPGINMNELSDLWQMAFLKKYYQAVYDGELTSELAYERLTGSYDYLEDRPEMREEIEFYDIYDESFAIKLKEQYGEADLTRYDFYMIDCDHMAEDVDVSDYSTVSALKQNSCYINTRGGQYWDIINEDGIDVDYSCFQFTDNETGEMIMVDISGFVEKGMAYIEEITYASKEECSAAMKAYNRIVLDNDTILYINKFDVWYRVGIKNAEPYFAWMTIDIDGILLQK